ncbi:MAG: hypothetical protein V3R90_16820 [Limibaculum sp.]
MALTTTCIGAYPKPDYLPIKDWFQVNHDTEDYVDEVVRGYAAAGAPGADALFDRATAEAVADQVACGIDIPTDGELPGWVADAVEPLPGVKTVNVELVWDPPWGMDMLSDEARLELGFI